MNFAPFGDLAARLLPHVDGGDDGSHDLSHLTRVWHNMRAIHAVEGGDADVLAAATLLHDCVAVEKDAPNRADASALAARRARGVLIDMGWAPDLCDAVEHAIHAHSFSANLTPRTIEARILQDADRLDAIGAIGVARCFYVAGRMGSQLYDPLDPDGAARDLDDRRFALDHFTTKLLRLSDGFQTATGRAMAKARHDRLADFRQAMLDEISGAA